MELREERKARSVKTEKIERTKCASVDHSTLPSDGSGGGRTPSIELLSLSPQSQESAESRAFSGCTCSRWALGSAITREPSASASTWSICRRAASGPGRIRLCRRMCFVFSSRMRALNFSRSRASVT